jgi:hypothetical protein
MFKYEVTRLLITNFRECFRFYRDVLVLQLVLNSTSASPSDENNREHIHN